jgi:hypothetical protein
MSDRSRTDECRNGNPFYQVIEISYMSPDPIFEEIQFGSGDENIWARKMGPIYGLGGTSGFYLKVES